jgi:hypothetical protein
MLLVAGHVACHGVVGGCGGVAEGVVGAVVNGDDAWHTVT